MIEETKNKTRCIYVEEEDWDKIKEESKKDRRSVSNYLVNAALKSRK